MKVKCTIFLVAVYVCVPVHCYAIKNKTQETLKNATTAFKYEMTSVINQLNSVAAKLLVERPKLKPAPCNLDDILRAMANNTTAKKKLEVYKLFYEGLQIFRIFTKNVLKKGMKGDTLHKFIRKNLKLRKKLRLLNIELKTLMKKQLEKLILKGFIKDVEEKLAIYKDCYKARNLTDWKLYDKMYVLNLKKFLRVSQCKFQDIDDLWDDKPCEKTILN